MITDLQAEQIRQYLLTEQLTDIDLIDDLTDHISCEIESLMTLNSISFTDAFEAAKHKILPAEPFQVQRDTKLLMSKTPNIMIRKIAFIGAYASTICLLIAAALFTVSSLSDRKLDLAQYHMQAEIERARVETKSSDATDSFSMVSWADYMVEEKDKSYNQLMQSQNFFLIALLIFSITYLPYQFYARFQKTLAEPQFG